MSILNVNHAEAAASVVLQTVRRGFTQLSTSGVDGYNLIWNSPSATPADVLAALGEKAETVFLLAQLNVQTINQAATIDGSSPPAIPSVPAGYTLTFDANGFAVLIGSPTTAVSSSTKPIPVATRTSSPAGTLVTGSTMPITTGTTGTDTMVRPGMY